MVARVPQAPVRLRRRRPPHRPPPGLRRAGRPHNAGHVKRAIDRLGLLQIDSVNVLARAHYLPLFSRLGNYDSDHLDRIAWGRKSQRGLFEFWAHEASLLPLASHPLWRWRMQRAARDMPATARASCMSSAARRRRYIDEVLARDRRSRAARRVGALQRRRAARRLVGLERRQARHRMAVLRRQVTTATRRGTFERVYDLTERVLPADGAGAADAVGRGGAARVAAHVGAGAGRRHRGRPARLLPARRRRHQGAARRAGRGGRPAAGRRSRAGTSPPISIPPRASRAASRRARCWRRSIR